MKKTVAITLAGLILAAAPAASAEPVKLEGEMSVKYQKNTAAGDPNVSGTMNTLKIRGEADLGGGWSLYGRLGTQYATNPLLADFNGDAYPADSTGVAAIDQFGLIRKAGGMVYKLGRQEATFGLEGLLYCRKDDKVGKHVFVDGLSAAGTIGATEISAIFAQEDNVGAQDNKLFVIRAGYSPSEKLNFGLTLGRYQNIGADSTNHWAVDGLYKFGKAGLSAQYAKASSSDANKAYAASLSYDFDDRAAISITGFKLEDNGAMGGQSDFDSGNKGVHYGFTYKLSEAAGLELVFKNQKTIGGGQKNTSFEATVSYSF
jgi:hypothetical protein